MIVLGAAGYLGYNFYTDRLRDSAENGDASSETAESAPHTPGSSAPGVSTAAMPAFKSRIDVPPATVPGEKRLAPPGVFYMLDRVVVETRHGVVAVVPGDKVNLLQRKPDRLKLTTGTVDFEVPLEKVTNDIDVAVEAERQDVMRMAQRR